MIKENFLNEYWRQKVCYMPNFLDKSFLSEFNNDSFFKWAKLSEEAIRLFQINPKSSERYGNSALIKNNENLNKLFKLLKEKGEAFTFHMNGVEKVENKVKQIRELLDIPYVLRLDDIIATLSTENSGIGYHSGHEDGFIIQLVGSRNWKVWSSCLTSTDYKSALLNPNLNAPALLKSNDKNNILIDVITEPGDILYIPPFCPHEGVTLKESLSLSIAWRGIAPMTFFQYLPNYPEGIHIDAEKAVTLIEDSHNIKKIKEKWVDATLKSINISTNQTKDELENIISLFIYNQIDKYYENQ